MRQAAAPSELKALQQQLAQKTAEVAKLQQELARLQPAPLPKSLPKIIAPTSELNGLQQQLTQKTAEVAKLHEELARLQSAPLPKSLPKIIAPTSELKALQQQLAQKTAEVAKLQQELARLQPAPLPKSSPKLVLRSQPIDKLSEEQVEKMLRDKNLFDVNKNKNGKGLAHQYEPLERKGQKLVLDQTTGLFWQQSGSDDTLVYKEAEKYVRELNQKRFAGYDDWRLPTLEEAMSLMEPKQHGELYLDRVFDHKQDWIWTSDHHIESAAWVVYFSYGYCNVRLVVSVNIVRVVRGG